MESMMKKLVCLVCALCLCLTLAVPTWADEGNPLGSATSIGTSGTVQGAITDDNKADFYRCTVSSGSSIEMKIKFTSYFDGLAVLEVLDSDGNELDTMYISENTDTHQSTESFTVFLNPGTYYLKVRGGLWDTGNYKMTYSTTALNNTDTTYDDEIASAHVLPLNTTINGILSKAAGDEIDIYKLNVPKAGVFKYNLKFYFKNIQVKLLDEDGNEINHEYFSWNDNLKMGSESFEIPLESGTYYLAYLREDDSGKYNVIQTYTDINSTEKEPNDTMEQAQSLKLGEKAVGMIAIGGDTDFYKISVPTKRNVTVSLPSKIDDTYLYVYDEEGNEIKRCYGSWNDNTKKSTLQKIYKLAAGTYYIQVKGEYRDSSYGTYTLTAATTKAPTQIKITTIKKTKKNWSGNRSIYVKLGKSSYAEGYQVYLARNSKFKGASKYIAESRSFTIGPLTKGTYYVKVRGYSQNSDGERIYGKFSTVKKIKL